jgi:basic amino acid/polyamine antiporter, APA family
LPEPQTSYAARLGLFDAAMAVVGGIIGAGIFRNPGEVAARVGTSTLVLAAWVIGGVIALAGAFCFAELGARRPHAGGGYVYLRDAFGPLPAFLYGWTLLLVINTGAMAWVAMTFATYGADLFGLAPSAQKPMAVAAIALLSAVNLFGVRLGAVTQNILTVLKLAALALVILVGLLTQAAVPAAAAVAAPAAPTTPWAIFTALGAALIPVLFSYGGWQSTNFIAGEIRDAQKQLPRALLIGVGIVVVVYVLANVAYLRVLGVTGLAASQASASAVMRVGLGPTGGSIIAAGIMVSTFGFLSVVILTAPRVYQTMAADGLFFASVAHVHPRYRTPAVALVFQAVWAIGVLLTGSYDELVNYVTFGDWLSPRPTPPPLFVSLPPPPAAGSSAVRPSFLSPCYPWPPLLFCLAALYVVVSALGTNPKNSLLAAGLILLGIPVFAIWRARTAASPKVVIRG